MIKKILFTALAVIVVFCLAEVVLRVANYNYEPFRDAGHFWDRFNQETAGETIFESDPAFFWRLRPDMNKHVHPDTMDYTTTNSNGFRGSEFPMVKPKGVFRVIFIGDSSTFGDGVRNKETFPAMTETLLKEENPHLPMDAINAGVPGYTSHQVLKYLSMELLDLSPDAVVVMVGANDMVPAKNRIPDNRRLQADPSFFETRKTFGKIKIYQVLMSIVSTAKGIFGEGSVKDDGKMVLRVNYDDFLKNLLAIKALGDQKGFSVIFMTVPHTFETEHLMNPHTRIATKQSGAYILDLAEKMKALQNQGELLYREDGGHPNPNGHLQIAKLLVPMIKELPGFPKQ